MTEETAKIFDRETIEELPWPDTENGELAKKVLLPFIKNGPEHYIDNVKTTMQALMVDNMVLPFTLNDDTRQNSYVCSPYTHYIHYAFKELHLVKGKLLRSISSWLVQGLGKILEWGEINKIIFVNNWLLPTNLYPKLTKEQVQQITRTLIERYPGHAVAFRSINYFYPPNLANHLLEVSYDLVISRMIYYTDTHSPEPFKSRMFKSDKKVLENSPYRVLENDAIPVEKCERIRELYAALNIEKHSAWNPQFNDHFSKLILENQWLKLKVLEHQNRIDAVLGYYTLDGVMNSPFFGYDTFLPQELGLYRQISTILLLDAGEKEMFLHQSAGGGHFKMLRRAKSALEYTAVYYHHLPVKRQLPWKILRGIMNVFGKWFLEHYKP